MSDKYFVFDNIDLKPYIDKNIELHRKGANSVCAIYNNNENILLFVKVKLNIRGYTLDSLEPEIFISSYINSLKLNSFAIYLDCGYICSDKNLTIAYLNTNCNSKLNDDEILSNECFITSAFNVKYNLHDFIKQEQRLPRGLSKMYIDMLIAYIKCGFSHNDLHSNNILIESDEKCRIIDLGRANLDINKLNKNILNTSLKEVVKINKDFIKSFDKYCDNHKIRSIGILNDFASISYFIYNSNIYQDNYNDIFKIINKNDINYMQVPISAGLVKTKLNNIKTITNTNMYLLGLLWLSAILTKIVQVYLINDKNLLEYFFISSDSKNKYFNIPKTFYSKFITSAGVIQAIDKTGIEMLENLHDTLENTKTKKEFETLIEYLVKNYGNKSPVYKGGVSSIYSSRKVRINQIEDLYIKNQNINKINIQKNNTKIEKNEEDLDEIMEEIYDDFDNDYIGNNSNSRNSRNSKNSRSPRSLVNSRISRNSRNSRNSIKFK